MTAAGIAARETDWSERQASDAELVAAVRAGDDSAFAALYRRHQPSLVRFVRARVRDHGRAEDVVQESFVSALRRMRQTDSELAFRAWIFEIARNASIDLYRRSSRAEEISMDVLGGLAPADAIRLSGPSGPDAWLSRKESFDHFRGALDELSDTHHRIIVERELEGRSYREIGERMELSQAAVESTLFRARRKLEHEYEQLDSGRRCRLVVRLIGRLAEGMESPRDRLRLDRHAKRCSGCRRHARELGVEPLLGERHRRIAARAAAFLPLPGFMRRRFGAGSGDVATGSTLQHGAHQMGFALAPSIEVTGGLAGKAVALIAAVSLIGGGGATLGGVGPLAVGGKDPVPRQTQPSGHAPAQSRSPESPAPDARVIPSVRAVGPHGAVARPPKTDDRVAPPARQSPSAPSAPTAGDQQVGPPPDLPAVSDPSGGAADPEAPGLTLPALPTLASSSPEAGALGVGAPSLTPPSAPDLGSIVGTTVATVTGQ